jgi:hypothetical protein
MKQQLTIVVRRWQPNPRVADNFDRHGHSIAADQLRRNDPRFARNAGTL